MSQIQSSLNSMELLTDRLLFIWHRRPYRVLGFHNRNLGIIQNKHPAFDESRYDIVLRPREMTPQDFTATIRSLIYPNTFADKIWYFISENQHFDVLRDEDILLPPKYNRIAQYYNPYSL